MNIEPTFKKFAGGKPPLVILHGLMGAARNWTIAGRVLAKDFEVFALDLRGHGDSPWVPDAGETFAGLGTGAPNRAKNADGGSMARDYSYRAFAGDVLAWMDRQGLCRPLLLGHSLGGKIAMRLAVDDPERIRGLVVVDIAPRDYQPPYAQAIEAMLAMDLPKISTRAEAEAVLRARVADVSLARFLLTNLTRGHDGAFRWRADVAGLLAALPQLGRSSLDPGESYSGPALFLRGAKSAYVRDGDFPAMLAHFPNHEVITLSGAGHNVHADSPAAFAEALRRFAAGLG